MEKQRGSKEDNEIIDVLQAGDDIIAVSVKVTSISSAIPSGLC